MAQTKVIAGGLSTVGQKINDYQQLVKFRLTLTVVFSALLAFAITSQSNVHWLAALTLGLGGFLITGAANALNHVLEKDFDKLMARTADRPLAAGRMTISEAVLAAGLMSLAGIMLLALFNPWAAFFGTLAMVLYAFVYTPMKRFSPLAIPVGAVPGALPMLIGCVAYEGQISQLALALFAIQFLWQFPHFWSIGWLGFDEYQKAGYRLLPMRDGLRDPKTGLYAALYALILIPVAALPFFWGYTGAVSAIFVGILGVVYAGLGWRLYRKKDRKAALTLMFFSFFYLPLTLIAFFVDKI